MKYRIPRYFDSLCLNYRKPSRFCHDDAWLRACVHIRSRTETDRLDEPEQTTCHSPLSNSLFLHREYVRVRRVGRIDNSHGLVFDDALRFQYRYATLIADCLGPRPSLLNVVSVVNAVGKLAYTIIISRQPV